MIPAAALAAMGGGALASGILGYLGDREQANAAEDAQAQNAALIEGQMGNQLHAGAAANTMLADAIPGVLDNREQGYLAGMDFSTQGFGQQREDLLGGASIGSGAIAQGMGGSLDALYGGAGQGINTLGGGLDRATDVLGNRQDRAGGMLDQAGGLYGNYQADPGYEFRRKAGEDSIRNMQAARGGRFGGAAMKELVDYNQQSASQEFGNYVNRANSEFGARSSSDQQDNAVDSQLAGMIGNTASQAAGMQYGTGQSAAGVYGSGASQLADIATGTGTQLGAAAAGAGATLGGASSDYYNGLGDLEYGTANQMGQNMLGAAGAGSALTGQAVANNQSTVPYAGQGYAAAANTAGQIGQMGVLAGILGGGADAGTGAAATVAPSMNPQQATTAPMTVGTGMKALPINPAILTSMGVR